MPRAKAPRLEPYRLLCEAPDVFGGVLFEGRTPEEARAKFHEANRRRAAAGKPPLTILPYTVIAL